MASRILLVPTFYLAEAWNGIDEHLLTLSRHLPREQFELVVVERPTDGEQTRNLADRACLELVPGPAHGMPVAQQARAYRQLYRDTGASLVHVHTPVAGGESRTSFAARLASVPALLTVHQIQPERQRLRSRLVNRAAQELLFRRTIAVSRDVRTSLETNAGLAGRRITVVPNGIDASARPSAPRAAGTASGDVRALCLARLSPEKGIDLLLEAFALAAGRGGAIRLDIAGDGPERANLERLSHDLGIDARVRFLGYQPNSAELLTAADLLIHTPRYEGFGLVVAEAMAASLPVVVTPAAGGIRDMVLDGVTGVVASDFAPASIAEALLSLANDPTARTRMGAAGRDRWQQHFTAERMADRTAAIYRRLLGTADPGSRPAHTKR